jgi:hypothetical protein
VECLTLRQEKEGMKTKLVTEISKIRVYHGVPNIALDKLFNGEKFAIDVFFRGYKL